MTQTTSITLQITSGRTRGPGKEWQVTLTQRPLVIGRGDRDVVVEDDLCSRNHAALYLSKTGALWIRDLSSRNGTFVNEVRVLEQHLQPGDVVRVGRTQLTVAPLGSEGAEMPLEPVNEVIIERPDYVR